MILSKKLNLDLINEHLTCHLCSGYLIDAWTINECLHSFCRPCIFSYFNDNDENTTCPICSTVPHPANPLLGITKDCWLQQIVYKLVPSLFKREMCQRRIYYDSNSSDKLKLIEQYTKTHSSKMGCREEELGELSERCLFQQKNKLNNSNDNIYITLEYNENNLKDFLSKSHIYFIECSSNMPINILKQYLKKVLPLSKRTRYQIDILYDQKILLDNLILNHIYSWKQNKSEKSKQLHLYYRVIIIEREENNFLIKTEDENNILQSIVNLTNSSENHTNTISSKPPAFIRSSNLSNNSNSFVHTTPFTPAEARTISLNNSITEQLHRNETIELIKPKECTLIDCKTFAISTPINYSMNSINEISKQPKKRLKKFHEQSSIKKCKIEKKKKIKEEKILHPLLPLKNSIISLNSSPSENKNPNEIIEQKQLSYSEVIQEANKLLAADESSSTPITNTSSSLPLTNPITTRLTKPIATVSPLHTSKNNHNRVLEKSDDDQLIDLSKSNITSNDSSLKLETNNSESLNETKKRSRQISSSTTRTKISRHSNKSNNDDGNDSTKSFKKTHSNMNPNQFLPPPPPPPPPPSQQQMFQNLFHSFQNQANYWPMTPWPVPPSLALMADPRNYYTQPWPSPQPPVVHGPKDLSSASLHDFIGETSPSVFPLPSLNSASNFSRTSSSNSLHLHHGSNRHRPATLNGTLS